MRKSKQEKIKDHNLSLFENHFYGRKKPKSSDIRFQIANYLVTYLENQSTIERDAIKKIVSNRNHFLVASSNSHGHILIEVSIL